MPCILTTVKLNDMYLPLFISFLLCSFLLPYKHISIYYGLSDDSVPRIRNKGWQYCCCRAAQRRRWQGTAPLAVFSLLHCHTAHPFLICRPQFTTLPLRLCLSYWWSVALIFVFSLSSFVFSSHPFAPRLIFFHVRVARKFLLGWCSHFLQDYQQRCKLELKKNSNRSTLDTFLSSIWLFYCLFQLIICLTIISSNAAFYPWTLILSVRGLEVKYINCTEMMRKSRTVKCCCNT